MAEQCNEQPALANCLEDMEEEEVVEAAAGLPIRQMALTLGRLKDRLKTATGGAVSMDAVLDDEHCYFHAQLRLCSGNADRKVRFLTRFRLLASEMKKGELFCCFGPGARAMLARHWWPASMWTCTWQQVPGRCAVHLQWSSRASSPWTKASSSRTFMVTFCGVMAVTRLMSYVLCLMSYVACLMTMSYGRDAPHLMTVS